MFESVIVDRNPHWDGTLYQEGVSRGILGKIRDYLELPHIIALVGVRRSGKSTLVRQAINHLIRDPAFKFLLTPPGTGRLPSQGP